MATQPVGADTTTGALPSVVEARIQALIDAARSGDTAAIEELTTALGGKADAASLNAHTEDTSNPHVTTKAQVGLGAVDNTSDADKPISTATQTALNLKANAASLAAKQDAATLDTDVSSALADTSPSLSRGVLDDAFVPQPQVTPPTGFALTRLPMPTIRRLGGRRFHVADYLTDLAPLMPDWSAGATWYVAADGTSANPGTSPAAPTDIDTAIASAADGDTISYPPGEYRREAHTTIASSKKLRHLATGPGVRVTGWNTSSIVWTLTSGNIYQTSRSATVGVVDVNNFTAWGDFTVYEKKADLASITGPGQWAIVGSTVYVWAIGNTDMTNTTLRHQIRLTVTAHTGITSTGAGVHYVKGIDFEGCVTGGLTASGGGLIIAEDCTLRYAPGQDGIPMSGAGSAVALIRCRVSSCAQDGISYRGTGEFVEIDVSSHHNGLSSPGTNNASTSHETVKGIRVRGDYDVSGGPPVADVNSAKTWNLGCDAGDSTVPTTDTSWRCDSVGYESDPAEMWLDECRGHTSTYAVGTTGTGGGIHLYGFKRDNPQVNYTTNNGPVDFYTPADVAA